MAISAAWIDELRARITLSSVIGRTVRVIKAGREFKACCPFHNEKTPSFTINDEKGFYHCFGCGAHGDVIRWMTDQRGLTFIDAVKDLAGEAGMEVPAADPRAAKRAEEAASLHVVTAAAQAWFVAQLAGEEGARARAYLATRGFAPATMRAFGFGYAPEGRQALKAALAQFPEAMLVEAGLRIVVEDKECYDRFRGRLMLPIEDARGRVIGFGGRILDAAKIDSPKYLNSPETPLFDKGRTLYNLHRAGPLARKSSQLIVVEGYMDAIALANAGIGEVVAPLGTALTEVQLALLWRLVPAPVLCFDGDAAGTRAAIRAATRALPLLRPGYTLSIARLPEGRDPDDVVRAGGAAAMAAVLASADTLVETLWLHERNAFPLNTPEAKAGLKARLLAHVEAIADRDIQALYRRELLARFSDFAFPPRDLARAPAAFGRPGARPARAFHGKPTWPAAAPAPADYAPRLRAATSGGARAGLLAAVAAGLVHWPQEIAANAEALTTLADSDPRIEALLAAWEAGHPLESAGFAAILAGKGLAVAPRDDQLRMRLPFLEPEQNQAVAVEALREAIRLLAEAPAIEAALAAALRHYEADLCDEARIEHERLRKRKLEFDARLGQMAGRSTDSSEINPAPLSVGSR